jgi:hypothetical protein
LIYILARRVEVEGEGEEWREIPRFIELDGWQHERA